MISKGIHCKGKQVQILQHGILIKVIVSIQEILQSGMDFINPIHRVIFIGQTLYLGGIIGFVLSFKASSNYSVQEPNGPELCKR